MQETESGMEMDWLVLGLSEKPAWFPETGKMLGHVYATMKR